MERKRKHATYNEALASVERLYQASGLDMSVDAVAEILRSRGPANQPGPPTLVPQGVVSRFKGGFGMSAVHRPPGVVGTGGYPGARSWAEDRFQRAHETCLFNAELVDASSRCGCFYCLAIFPPTEVDSWCDGKWIGGLTALCPRCGIDSVLPDVAGFRIDRDFLEAMQLRWCQSAVG